MTTRAGGTILEGTWEETSEHAAELAGRRVRVTILSGQGKAAGAMITLGMFPELAKVTDEDFKAAEVHGDSDDDRRSLWLAAAPKQ
jgi:hypothetical protein